MRKLVVTLISLGISATALGIEKEKAEVKADYLRPYVVSTDDSQAAKPEQAPKVDKKRIEPSDNTCYTMRSMLVQKEPGTDVTQVVGQRTCTASSKFQMKHSVQQAK